jgi:signal transduction histidine kinase
MDTKSSELLVDRDELLKHRFYLEALDQAAGILLHSISEIRYKDFLSALGPASAADRLSIFFKNVDSNGNISLPIREQWIANQNKRIISREYGHNFFIRNIWRTWEPVLSQGKPVFSIVRDFPSHEHSFWKEFNIKAVLALPIIIDFKLEGFISFDNCTNERQWSRSEIDFLNTAANNLAIAIKRLEIKNELKKAHAELEQRVEQRTVALKEANVRLLKTIEERDHIQNLLRETEKLAAAGKLAAQIAHEINNPLAGIKNSLLLIEEAVDKNHKYYEYIGSVEKEIDRVSNIVKQMFDLYRPTVSAAKIFYLYNSINDVAKMLTAAGNQKNINIEINCDKKMCINSSEDLLRQIIYNLINNAIHAGGQNTKVEITASSTDHILKMSVTDEGPGIDDKIKDRIFEPFFTTGMGGPESGLGLGLAITKDIITAMRGEINFENIKPKGAQFNISIPLNDEPVYK